MIFYSRHSTPRRLFEMGLLALNEVCQKHSDLAVIFAGGDVSQYDIPFHHLNAGSLALNELPDLYSQCDLALVLSGTNLSLLPLELAACNCPLVLNDMPSANWLLPKSAAFYAKPTIDDLVRVLDIAVSDPKKRASKSTAAQKFVHKTSWQDEAIKLAQILGFKN